MYTEETKRTGIFDWRNKNPDVNTPWSLLKNGLKVIINTAFGTATEFLRSDENYRDNVSIILMRLMIMILARELL